MELVVGVDGSGSSLQAVDWAADEAARRRAALRLVHASGHEHHERTESTEATRNAGRGTARSPAERLIASAVERAQKRAPQVSAEGAVVDADAVEALLAEDRRAWAIVIGSHGHGTLAGLLLGSVGLAVSARAHCPVVVVRGAAANIQGANRRITLGVGDSPKEADVARFALGEAEVRGCELHAVRAWRAPAHEMQYHPLLAGAPHLALEEQASEALTAAVGLSLPEDSPATLHREIVEGAAGKVLVDAAATSDLLVVGATRRREHGGLQLGRVSHAVLHHASCPVAVVPRFA